jgi:glycerophosphoryl diester phosphodiesterase
VRAGALYSARALENGPGVAKALADAKSAGVGFVGLAQALVTPEAVAEARRAGVLLGAWTVNDPDAMRRLIALPIDVLITDRPGVARDLVTRRTP